MGFYDFVIPALLGNKLAQKKCTREEALEKWNTRPVLPIFKKLRRINRK